MLSFQYIVPLLFMSTRVLCGTASPAVSVFATIPDTPSQENLAVRHDGTILVTSLDSPGVFLVSSRQSNPPVLVAQVPGVNATLGIAELEEDVFYVIASNVTGFTATNNEIWRLDMRSFDTTATADLSLVASFPDALVFNGMTRLAKNDTEHILVADSGTGAVVRINVRTGDSAIVISDPTMAPSPSGVGIGINGLHTFDNKLFFVNYDEGTFASVPISLVDGTSAGPVEIIVDGPLLRPDDFALSRDGSKAWIADKATNVLPGVDIAAKTYFVAANSTLLGNDTSVVLGRTPSDMDTLYISSLLVLDTTVTEGLVIKAVL
jgi:hypothetical protein